MIRSVVRAVYHVVSELIPAQALRCIVDRDFSDAMYTAATKHDGAEQRAEYEAEEEVSEPMSYGPPYVFGQDVKVGEKYCGLCGVQLGEDYHACPVLVDRGTGVIDDGEPQRVTLSGREYERYLDGALNEPVDTPNPYEPGLTDDELVAVRQLIEERFPLLPAASAEAAGSPEAVSSPPGQQPTFSQTFRLGPNQRHAIWTHGDVRRYRWQPKQQFGGSWMWTSPDGAEYWRECNTGAADIQSFDGVPFTEVHEPKSSADGSAQGPAERPAGLTQSPSESPAGHLTIAWLAPAVMDILAEHHYRLASEACDCGYKPDGGLDPYDWREHVAPILLHHITHAIAAQPK